jgi:hypothetical protein
VNRLRVLNLGAGVQSTAVYLMAHAGEIPPIDCAIFADTQEEPRAVYDHLGWLESLSGALIVRIKTSRLGDDLMCGKNSTGQRFASIPAYTAEREGGNDGMVRRQCTKEYKIEPIERYIRRNLLGVMPGRRVAADIIVTQLYGISADESGRSVRIRERLKERRWIAPEFPLIDRWMTRADCVRWLARFGVPHQVPKSSCVFCPFKNNANWRHLRDTDAAGWSRAVAIDHAMRQPGVLVNRGLDQSLYLHRSCRPLDVADLGDPDPRQAHLDLSWVAECAGMCGV